MVKKVGLPAYGENVIVTVKSITPNSALCTLDEYNNVEGMIHVSEVSGKWVKDIRKYVKVDKKYVAKVISVDERKKFVLLSLKRLSKREKDEKMNEIKREQRAEKLLSLFARKKGISLEKAYELIGYKLQEIYGDIFVGFEYALKQPENLIKRGISKEDVALMKETVNEFMKRKITRIKAEIRLKFFGPNGIKRIKEVLTNIKNKYNLDIKYVSAPKYLVVLKTNNPKSATKELSNILSEELSKIKDGEAEFEIIGRENE
ncbi:MAG: S1 RNA-binding domain-containing protein [Candidatus Aenigmarchaeota archaeon]|nr:S1 RNA-binding domain-containing protein [Candidatus Aenigmarchaeota archaeon]MCX8179682.1 S1 RNA-binding domain-containing protein [Candidatus Aenigmarchaeota archaeon]